MDKKKKCTWCSGNNLTYIEDYNIADEGKKPELIDGLICEDCNTFHSLDDTVLLIRFGTDYFDPFNTPKKAEKKSEPGNQSWINNPAEVGDIRSYN